VPETIRSSRLPPLRWVAEEPLVYDQAANELHRPACTRAAGGCLALARGDALDLVWAPVVCAACEPDVTLGLGR
jgi:hypothetical protein